MKSILSILPVFALVIVASVSTDAQSDTSSQSAASAASTGVWNPVHVFIGSWTGVKSVPGTSQDKLAKVARKYETGDKSVQVTDRTGDTDWETAGAIRLDPEKGRLVLAIEGAGGKKSNLALEADQSTETRLVFLGVESNPGQTRVTYERLNWNEFIERVEYAPQGKEFALVSETRFKRKN
jgi:hypothetical protein